MRAFCDFRRIAELFGADVGKRVLSTEDRIRTFFVDQLDPASFDSLQTGIPGLLDLIVDDGLHSPDANLATAMFAVKKLQARESLVIEDIPLDAAQVWQRVNAVLSSHYETGIFQAASSLLFVTQRAPWARCDSRNH